jgi:hypothetical protein
MKYLFLCPVLSYILTFFTTWAYWSFTSESPAGSMFPLFVVYLTIITAYVACGSIVKLVFKEQPVDQH